MIRGTITPSQGQSVSSLLPPAAFRPLCQVVPPGRRLRLGREHPRGRCSADPPWPCHLRRPWTSGSLGLRAGCLQGLPLRAWPLWAGRFGFLSILKAQSKHPLHDVASRAFVRTARGRYHRQHLCTDEKSRLFAPLTWDSHLEAWVLSCGVS